MEKNVNKSFHKKSKNHNHGFTLIELLISFSIIMLLILGGAQLILHSILVKRQSDYSVKSAELASSKLEYFKSLPFESEELNEGFKRESFKVDTSLGSYQREWRIQNISPDMKEIEMECFSENCPQKKIRLVLFLSRTLGF